MDRAAWDRLWQVYQRFYKVADSGPGQRSDLGTAP